MSNTEAKSFSSDLGASSGTVPDGGPAFPCEVDSTQPMHRQVGNTVWQTYGLTMRDYFAAKALPAVLAICFTDSLKPGETPEDMFARKSYAIADAMLRVRSAS